MASTNPRPGSRETRSTTEASLRTGEGRRSAVVPVVIVAVAVVLIVVALATRSGSGDRERNNAAKSASTAPADPDTAYQEEVSEFPDMERRIEDDPLAIGAEDAPVGLVMYSDFQCPFCAKWTTETLPELMPYVEAGDLRIEWRDVAVFGPDSRRAAMAAYAAGANGKYLEFHEALFNGGDKPSASELTDEGLAGVAERVGVDRGAYESSLEDPTVMAAVEANIAEANRLGVYSTPSFLLNSRPVVGAQPAKVFIDMVEAELDGAGSRS